MIWLLFRNTKYYVSPYGDILTKRSKGSKKYIIRKPFINEDGYKQLNLTINGEKHFFLISRIVAELYVENPFNLNCVNHIDTDKLNNYFINLEWCTAKYNSTHAANNGLYANNKGELNPYSKLTEEKVKKIRELHSTGKYSHQQIGIKFDVHRITVLNIVRRQTWAHI